MLERLVSEILVKILGSYLDGINRENVSFGVWAGDLELRGLRIRSEALAVLFETMALDLPVTVTAGYVGLLRLEVPWKRLRSAPVRIVMNDVTVVASPVSDGDQAELEVREKRLKAARLATDEAVRDAKFSMRTGAGVPAAATDANTVDETASADTSQRRMSLGSSLGFGWWRSAVTKIIDNIQVEVENVIVQYEDASSVRGCPYTASLAIDSLKACSTDVNWRKMYLEDASSPIVHKVVNLEGLVLNWEPGTENNPLRQWILDSSSSRTPGHWSGFVRACKRHAIKPLNCDLRISLVKMRALAEATSSKDEATQWLTKRPKVEMDLHFPEVGICLDDFNYHTLLSSIMYLSDIDRRVRPKDPLGRWYWALDRLLPRFKERRKALLLFNAAGLRQRRELREAYCKARNSVLSARRKGAIEDADDIATVETIEGELPYDDILLFRDISDRQLLEEAKSSGVRTSARIWSLFNPWRLYTPSVSANPSSERDEPHTSVTSGEPNFESNEPRSLPGGTDSTLIADSRLSEALVDTSQGENHISGVQDSEVESGGPRSPEITVPLEPLSFQQSVGNDRSLNLDSGDVENGRVAAMPSFRMALLLERGVVRLSRGGYPDVPVPISSLEFRELRLGITTTPGSGFLLEAVLGTFEAIDLMKQVNVMYARAPWLNEGAVNEDEDGLIPDSSPDADEMNYDSVGMGVRDSDEVLRIANDSDEPVAGGAFPCATERSYPSDVSLALQSIRGDLESESGSSYSSCAKYHYHEKEGSSSSSLSALSDGCSTKMSSSDQGQGGFDTEAPLKYIAALRLSQEAAPRSGEGRSFGKHLSMDLAIGGMEVVLDGPNSAFIASAAFWSPREKLPSIMYLLSRSAAPKLALLRMEMQQAILDHKSPMRMDLHIRGPRFVIAPVQEEKSLSIVVDLGTFAMETATSEPTAVPIMPSSSTGIGGTAAAGEVKSCVTRYTDYRMTCSDLGVFVVSQDSSRNFERLVKPFSLNLVLQVLHDPSYVEAVTIHLSRVDVAKVKLAMSLSSLKTTISHRAFRQILAVAKGWTSSSVAPQPAPVAASSGDPEVVDRHSVNDEESTIAACKESAQSSPLISFEMHIDLDNLFLELRDSSSRRIVTVSSVGTVVMMKRRPGVIDFSYRVQSFTVTDGSRGATAPFRRLAHAGMNDKGKRKKGSFVSVSSQGDIGDEKAFIVVSYSSDLRTRAQTINVKVLSLSLVCVRETYLALADFFYLVGTKPAGQESLQDPTGQHGESSSTAVVADDDNNTVDVLEPQGEYSDPFNALGMTTVSAARKLREKANLGMELSKQALAERGKLVLSACLDGLSIVLVSAEGAIASFEISDCTTRLEQMPRGSIQASGQFGGFGIKDLTAAYAVHSDMLHYSRGCDNDRSTPGEAEDVDGWTLKIPASGEGDSWLSARLRNLNILYLQRFVIILKKYFDVLRENLQPVLDIKGGIAEVFDDDVAEDISALAPRESRLRLNLITENINVIMPRHSQSPHEALRFVVRHSSVTNEDEAAPGYRIGIQVSAKDVNGFVLYDTTDGISEKLLPIDPCGSTDGLVPFTDNVYIASKLDLWRKRRVPQVILNAEGIPVLKDGEDEREFDPAKWLPSIRVRVCAPNGLNANLCEAQYSILYFTFTENVIERPDIEFTDIVRGLKTPVLPPRRPVRPIMLSSHRMPPNYQVLFEVPSISSTIMHGGDPTDVSAKLIRTELLDIVGSFEYGVDFRMSAEVNASLHSLTDIRPHAIRPNAVVISSTVGHSGTRGEHSAASGKSETVDDNNCASDEESRSVTLTWDRAYGYRANVMVVVSDLRIIVVPELFRDLGRLTGPGFPFLKSSAPAPFLRFNGRLLILTVSRPEIWLMAHQYAGDCRSLVLRGDIIAKVQWAAVTGRNTVELAAHGLYINLSSSGPKGYEATAVPVSPASVNHVLNGRNEAEVPLLYPSDVALKHQGSGYDPPKSPGEQPTKAPGSELVVNAESLLLRVDVNDIPLILSVGSRLARLRPSVLSIRPVTPGRFDEWIDKGEDGDARLFVSFALPHARLIFTDETAGHYIPIMELRVRNAIVRSNISWMTSAKFEFSIDLFNDEKGWWEPGLEPFPVEIAVSKGRSGSEAVHVRTEQTIDANITPTTISGATRVAKTLKHAIEDLIKNLKSDLQEEINASGEALSDAAHPIADVVTTAQRPSVAAFCVKNNTGRSISLWLPYDSMRRNLRGNGEECEIAMPTEDLMWSAMAANARDTGDRLDGNRDRHLSMQCMVSLTGYDPVSLTTTEVGSQIVYFFPEASVSPTLNSGQRKERRHGVLTLVWTVFMRNGVPVGCLRSVFRIVNRTRTIFEVKIGQKTGDAYKRSSLDSSSGLHGTTGEEGGPIILKAGESWSIPVHAVERTICFRPAIFHPPDTDSSDSPDDSCFSPRRRKRVLYSYRWSDPLSKFSSLLAAGVELEEALRSEDPPKVKKFFKSIPALSCRAANHGQPFSCLVIPEVGSSPSAELIPQNGSSTQWVDVVLSAPLVISNALPRPLSFAITNMKQGRTEDPGTMAKDWVEPLRDIHVHTAGTDSSRLSFGIGYDNSSGEVGAEGKNLKIARSITSVYKDLGSLQGIPVGVEGEGEFYAKIDRSSTSATERVQLYADFWIRNRSSVDLMFRNAENIRDLNVNPPPERYLRRRAPGTQADKYVAFSGPWISFRTVAQNSVWKTLNQGLMDIDGSVSLNLNGVSLLAEVRPAKGDFQKTLIVTIRNAMWIENKADVLIQWCQPAALDSRGIALSSNVHTALPGECLPLHWDFEKDKSICLRRSEDNGSSDWIWSRPVSVDGNEGEFAAKMYRPKNHQQYIARIIVSRLSGGVGAIIIHREDRRTPPYRIINSCQNRSIAFWQSGVHEKSPWLVRPGKATRYSWDDPQSPLRRRSITVKVIEVVNTRKKSSVSRSVSTSALHASHAESVGHGSLENAGIHRRRSVKEIQYPTFNLNIDIVQDEVNFRGAERFKPGLDISVQVDGPTKVVTFSDAPPKGEILVKQTKLAPAKSLDLVGFDKTGSPAVDQSAERVTEEQSPAGATKNLDVGVWIHSLGLSFIDDSPVELAYLLVSGMHFRLDRFDGQQLVICEVEDVQLDNQLTQCTWPVVLWSPPAQDQLPRQSADDRRSIVGYRRSGSRKPFFQLTVDGPFPHIKNGIGNFRGIFLALQQLQIAADEDFVLRVWIFVQSIIAAAGGATQKNAEILGGNDGQEHGLRTFQEEEEKEVQTPKSSSWSRLYVKHLELCPLKLTISFTSSRTSTAAARVGGFRSVIRTLVAVLGNVENAEFRFNALELRHVFDTTEHFRSLIAEFYISQGSNQKMTLLTSNSLIGNPSALFDSIAIGARDFFVEPAKAKGSADFIAGIGRGSSSLFTNTVGGIVGSLGGIPRAVAHGLETAVGDKDYLAERESIRGGRARAVASPAQGLYTGALSFGHGIASGAAGLFREPFQGAVEHGASGFVKGLRRGVIGGVLKPITGALDLIAEPAAGFRSLMVSERNKNFAEPKRPPRAFLGAHRDRLALYDLRSALGAAVFHAVLGSDNDAKRERLVAWVDFAPRNSLTPNENVAPFLWALMRRSTRSSNLGHVQLTDSQGVVQRADKIRAGLITSRRLIVSSLDGNVFWEYPLMDVVDTQASLESKEYLSVGLRPVGYSSRDVVAPTWERIHCGSVSSRDSFNVALKKALNDFGLIRARQRAAIFGLNKNAFPTVPKGDHTHVQSFEMKDLSSPGETPLGTSAELLQDQSETEMKALHADASADGRRGVFTKMSLPGRSNDDDIRPDVVQTAASFGSLSVLALGASMKHNQDPLSLRLTAAMNCETRGRTRSVRSVRIFVVNRMDNELRLVRSTMESGEWAVDVPQRILPKSIAVLEAIESTNRVKDVSGSFVYQVDALDVENHEGFDCSGEIIALRFVNPMLASNAYAVNSPKNLFLTCFGGEKGDHPQTVVNIVRNDGSVMLPPVTQSKTKLSTASEEPLLFGRSKMPPLITPPARPPHAVQAPTVDPNDPDLISKLASLGFSNDEAHRALVLENGDLSKAYARLAENSSDAAQ